MYTYTHIHTYKTVFSSHRNQTPAAPSPPTRSRATHAHHIEATYIHTYIHTSIQNSLLKSPQPDACSPLTSNPLSSYTRAVYFILTGLLLLLFNTLAEQIFPDSVTNYNIYGIEIYPKYICIVLRDACCALHLLLPVVFLLGWFPQCDTLTHHILEQVHMHIFGGSGSCSLLPALAACIWDAIFLVSCYALVTPAFNLPRPFGANSDKNSAPNGGYYPLPHTSPRLSGALGLTLLWAYVTVRMPSDMQSLSLCLWETTNLAEKPIHDVAVASLQVSSYVCVYVCVYIYIVC